MFDSNTHTLLNSVIFVCLILVFAHDGNLPQKKFPDLWYKRIYAQVSSYNFIMAVKRCYESCCRTYLEAQDGKEDLVKNQAKEGSTDLVSYKYRVHVNDIHAM